MNHFSIVFPEVDVEITAVLLREKAPETCKNFWNAIERPIEVKGVHAMYTGKEISTQLPVKIGEEQFGQELTMENLTCFPLPGELLFTHMPAYSFGGNPASIFDIGIFYGRDARTFFPMGWLSGNAFAQVINEKERKKLEEIGKHIHQNGKQTIIFKKG